MGYQMAVKDNTEPPGCFMARLWMTGKTADGKIPLQFCISRLVGRFSLLSYYTFSVFIPDSPI